MYCCRAKSLTADQEHLKCGTYANDKDECTAHFIRTIVLKEIVLGELKKTDLMGVELCVISPGIPLEAPFVAVIDEAKIPIWSEIELAYHCSKGKLAAITGTNGKTTTTALTGEIMKKFYKSVFVVGNIGDPYTAHALETTDESVTVAEVSSFQLETISKFAPKVSAILNITEDHLNRHHTMAEYIRVKELITSNQGPEDVCVLNYEDEVLCEFGKHIVPKTVYFSSARRLEQGIFLEGDQIILRTKTEEIPVVKTGDLKLLGLHNFENVMAAVAMAYCAGVDMDSIRKSVCEFTAVEHRIEYVTEKKGVAYYNDSKGTNPDAAIKGIQAMNRPTLLIGGGYDKESSYDEWIQAFDGKVRYLVLIGQTKEKIKAAAEKNGFHDIILCEDLKEAVQVCADKANAGESFVVVGRCAETMLKYHPALVSIFVLSDWDAKVERIMRIYELTREEAESFIFRSDRKRKDYHNYYCKIKWGDSRNYDLCVNSSRLGEEETVLMLKEYIDKRIAHRAKKS